jgi:hypothetical protein
MGCAETSQNARAVAASVPRRRRADLGSRDARKEDFISNRYDREHDRCSCENQNSLPKGFRRCNFPHSRLLGLFGETGKKESGGKRSVTIG